MMNEVITEINMEKPIGVRRFQILVDGSIKDFDENGNIFDKQHYVLSTSRSGSIWNSIGELTRDEIITLGMLIHRFIDETK